MVSVGPVGCSSLNIACVDKSSYGFAGEKGGSNELEGKWSAEVPESPCLGPGRFAEGAQGTLFRWPRTANVEIRNSSNGFGSNFLSSTMPTVTIKDDGELMQLASSIHTAAANIKAFCETEGLQQPSSSLVPKVPRTLHNAPYFEDRDALLAAAEQLIRLVRGPREHLIALSFEHNATASLQIIMKYSLARHVPLKGTTTYGAIAKAVGKKEVTPALVGRVLEHAATFDLFDVRSGGVVSHNITSSLLVTDPDLESWMEINATVAYPAGAAIVKALETYGYSPEVDEAPFGVSIGRKIGQFEQYREPRADGKRYHEIFARAMKGIGAEGNYDYQHVVDGGYPWHELEKGAGHLVVDIGGGTGHVSVAVAKRYRGLRFEVQDLPETIEMGEQLCPVELKGRIKFRPNDFMTPQTPRRDVQDEGVAYFCRWILHDWSDKYASKILQGLVCALRPQDRIIINEVLVPEPGTDRHKARRVHDGDLLMYMNLNGRERNIGAFEELGKSVTPQLRVHRVHHLTQGALSIIEMVRVDSTL
ncbi:hypothetical protein MCOR02_004943 [Pyricularia oryzae]|nr:hypothetical protein MCOR02_004943 [Pyricularia oryzae]KAI6476341.1 hypothetical protein MCOR17_001144 [Pyricularia oryzae]KAI6643679.1 hypothetical protein MCOR14_001909 [Pyricularia oryzae]